MLNPIPLQSAEVIAIAQLFKESLEDLPVTVPTSCAELAFEMLSNPRLRCRGFFASSSPTCASLSLKDQLRVDTTKYSLGVLYPIGRDVADPITIAHEYHVTIKAQTPE